MAIIELLLMFAALAAGLWVASKVANPVDKLFSLIWTDPTEQNRNKVRSRIKELCVDGDIPSETAILLASQEMGMTEKSLREALGNMTPQVMKAIAKGDSLSVLLKACLKASKKMNGGRG